MNMLPLTSGAEFRIMSANCLFDSTAESRAPVIAENFKYYSPDLIGMQEINKTFYKTLIPAAEKFGYSIVTARPDPEKRSEEELQSLSAKYSSVNFFPILYKSKVFEEVESVFRMYRSTFTYTKGFTWAVFRRRSDGRLTAHINTHCALVLGNYGLDKPDSVLGAEWRLDNARQLLDARRAINEKYGHIPVFITGDFNGNETEPYYHLLTENGMSNTKYIASEFSTHMLASFHYRPGKAPASGADSLPIDHIFTDASVTNIFRHSIETRRETLEASDHCFVFADAALI